MLTKAEPVCLVRTADLARARLFYNDTLGPADKGEDPYAVAHDLAGTMLRWPRRA